MMKRREEQHAGKALLQAVRVRMLGIASNARGMAVLLAASLGRLAVARALAAPVVRPIRAKRVRRLSGLPKIDETISSGVSGLHDVHLPSRRVAFLWALVLACATSLPAKGQQSACSSHNGGYQAATCKASEYYFFSNIRSPSGQFSTGTAACIYGAGNAYGTSYRNAEFVVSDPQWGTGCAYDYYSNGTHYEGRFFYQNWVDANQSCNPSNDLTRWVDTADLSVDIAGRLWCVYCPAGTKNMGGGRCVPFWDKYHDKPKQCPAFGHPIHPLTGAKSLIEPLGAWSLGRQSASLSYSTRRKTPSNDASLTFTASAAPSFGPLWASSLHKSLVLQSDSSGVVRAIQADRGSTTWVSHIRQSNGSYLPDSDIADRLVATSSAWRYADASAQSEETYDSSGRLVSVSYASGASLSYSYSDASTPVSVAPAAGLLIKIQDQNGRNVQFQYTSSDGSAAQAHISQLIDPNGSVTSFGYDASGSLTSMNWPDGKGRQYLYERSDIPWALTGITDENASRLATYGYDSQGRANDTQWAGGADHYSASYTSPPAWNIVETYDSAANIIWRDHSWSLPQGTSITLPNGSAVSLGATLVNGMPRLTSQSQPAGSGCAASSNALSYDANGNVASSDDFNGSRICHASDLTRNLETTRVEGVANTQPCSAVTPAGSALPTGSRKVSTAWHPDWRIETKRAEPSRLTTSIYNGQPDPFNGNAIASCAPSTALLPDGKPIAVLCKQVEQATSDANGSQGFSASLQSGVASRTRRWTYNQYGQVLTEIDPLNNTTSYAYYSDTTADHTLGDLQSATNAKTQVTSYGKYNKHGQLLESTDPNGVATVNTYDLRQRLLSASVGGQTTSYEYDAVGQLLKVTSPDTSWIGYEYDAAHRQTAIKDNLGNRIEYVLDNAGNKTSQSVKDPGGNLSRSLARSIDALGRVQQTTGRE